MHKTLKEEFRKKSIEELESDLKKLEFQLVGSQKHKKELGFNPEKGSPTKLIRDTKRKIAFIKTILNQKRQITDSLIRCKNKNTRRRRRIERRLK